MLSSSFIASIDMVIKWKADERVTISLLGEVGKCYADVENTDVTLSKMYYHNDM